MSAQARLKFECDYMRFFSPFDGAVISSPVSQTGNVFLKRFVQETGLKYQLGLKFAM